MATGRRTTRIAATNDEAVAGALGVVLLLALAVTAVAMVERVEVPRWGATAEQGWDGSVRRALGSFTADAGQGVAAHRASVTTTVPTRAEDVASVELPLLGTLTPIPGSGSLGFQPECASVAATHGAPSVVDLSGAARGCLVFRGETAYAAPFAYVMEAGALLRIQGDGAAVVVGPPIELGRIDADTYRVALTVVGLRGPAITLAGAHSARVVLTPAAAAGGTAAVPNAGSATWTIDTQHPAAWKAWFEGTFSEAGFLLGTEASVTCDPVDCSVGPSGLGRAVVTIEGPHTGVADLVLSMTHGVYDVSLE